MKTYELDGTLRGVFGDSESWDADGIQIDFGNDVKKAVAALDCTSDVLDYAFKAGADTVVTHHPLIFHPLDTVSVGDAVGKRVIKAVRHGISVLSYHTCLDKTAGGVNDALCEKLGIRGTYPFLPYGRRGEVENEMALDEFVSFGEMALETKAQNVVDCGRKVKKVAVVSGSGKGEVADAYSSGADTYVTGEASHDAMIDCREYGMNLVCFTHFATENVVIPRLAEIIREYVPEVIEYGI